MKHTLRISAAVGAVLALTAAAWAGKPTGSSGSGSADYVLTLNDGDTSVLVHPILRLKSGVVVRVADPGDSNNSLADKVEPIQPTGMTVWLSGGQDIIGLSKDQATGAVTRVRFTFGGSDGKTYKTEDVYLDPPVHVVYGGVTVFRLNANVGVKKGVSPSAPIVGYMSLGEVVYTYSP